MDNTLSLEELRNMDGEPVWVNERGGFWAIVNLDCGGVFVVAPTTMPYKWNVETYPLKIIYKSKPTEMKQTMDKYAKPPLGLMPHYVWIEQRIEAIEYAVKRYIEAQHPIPIEWITEYNGLMKEKEIRPHPLSSIVCTIGDSGRTIGGVEINK